MALVYAGPGVCKEGCERAAAEIAKHAGYRVRYFVPGKIGIDELATAKIWIQPGGNAIEVATAVGPEIINHLRSFVFNGGGYLGFCAGAFLADHWVDDNHTVAGLDILNAETEDYVKNPNPIIVFINWLGKARFLYYQEGPYFIVRDPANAKVVASYEDGKPAVVYSQYGRGHVAVSGPHPEAPEKWRKIDALADADGLDIDLALEMISSLKHDQ